MQRELILRLYYDPHHRAFGDAVDKALRQSGQCLIVDAHSFSATPLPYEPGQDANRPDICIGTCAGHTTALLEAKAVRFFKERGFSVRVNYPYAGTMAPLRHLGDRRVQSIMVEINRRLYRHPEDFRSSSKYAFLKRTIGDFLATVAG